MAGSPTPKPPREAVELAGSDQAKERDALVQLGTTLGLQGQISQAIAAFDTANDLQHRIDVEKAWVYSFNGVKWAELLIRLGRAADARSVTEANLIICRRNQWQDGIARCYWLLGCLDTLADADDDAATHLTEAATILRGAQLLPDLSQVLLARANLDRRRRALGDAERHVDEALAIVSSRRMAVLFADALVLRGCIHLDRGHTAEAGAGDTQRRFAEHALDDADDARILAQRHSYAWAERDAALLRADAYTTLGDAERAHDARRQAEHLDRRMKPAT